MPPLISYLTEVRKRLVAQQSSINECLTLVDALIINQIDPQSLKNDDFTTSATDDKITKKFPLDVVTKRAKLQFILLKAQKPMTAKEVKDELRLYGENLPNVDQSLVNLEKVRKISARVENGKKKVLALTKTS